MLIECLVETNKVQEAKALASYSEEYKHFLLSLLTTNDHAKSAAKFIKAWKFNINDYPDVKERLMKATTRYYMGRYLYNKKDQKDYMELHKIEDLFDGIKPMLAYLADDLAFKGKLKEAKGIMLRHDI